MQDFRLAIRSLRATPIVTAIAILSLALGIGANTAIFSLVDSLILRPLPGVAEPDRLVTLSSGATNDTGVSTSFEPRWSYTFWKEIEKRSELFGGALAWSAARLNVSLRNADPQSWDGVYASGAYFQTLGVRPLLGRTFTVDDDVPNGASTPVAVISYGLWQRQFGGSPQVLGMPLIIEGIPFTVVGITPPEFSGLEVGRAFDIAVPLGTESLIRSTQSFLKPPFDRFNYWLIVALRLKPQQTSDAATAMLRNVQSQIREAAQPQLPQARRFEFLKEPFTLTTMATGTSQLRRLYRRPLLAVLAIVAVVLLVACANIANLQLARAIGRHHELSVRRALGATRWRLSRELLAESLIMAGVGAGLGVTFATWSSRLLVAQIASATTPITLDLSLDWRVLSFTTAVAVITALAFGVAPALRASDVPPIEALNAQRRGLTSAQAPRLSGGLVALQVGLSLLLVVFAELFVGTFERLARRPLGFDAGRVLVARVNTARAVAQPTGRAAFFGRLVTAATSIPGVAHAAASMTTPVDGSEFSAWVHVSGVPREAAGQRIASRYNFVTPGWFSTYGTSLRAGRDLDASDGPSALPVIVVNESFVRKFLGDGGVIGRTVGLTLGPREEYSFGTKTVIGVVGDAVITSLREPPQPMMYVPLAQWDLPIPLSASINVSVRSGTASPAGLVRGINEAFGSINRNLTVTYRTLDVQVSESFRQERLVAMLSGFFGGLALLLALLGLYGITAYSVAQRRAEIGIRMALGAAPDRVVRLVLSRVALLVGAGILIGAVVSLWASKFVASLLYGVQPRDPVTLIGAAAILATVSALAGWLPAWRASRIDPAEVLREA